MDVVELSHGPMRVRLLAQGAITQGWWFDGIPMILGYAQPEDYFADPYYMGAIVGPVANRIGGGGFALGGDQVRLMPNEGETVLHSGQAGLSNQRWALAQLDAATAVATHNAAHGQAGFPGPATFEVKVVLSGTKLIYEMRADTLAPTPISLAQHNYYALGASTASDLTLKLAADRVLSVSDKGVTDGKIEDASDAKLDFRTASGLRDLPNDIDRFFLFDSPPTGLREVAELAAPSGLKLRISSDQPGAQVYTGHALGGPFAPKAGLCIEPSGYPNAVNHPHFPTVIYDADHAYVQRLVLEVVA